MSTAKVSNTGKIELMIIGAQKAGTTSLNHYLGQHPDIQTHQQKEFGYFSDDKEYAKDFTSIQKKYFKNAAPEKILIAKNTLLYYKEKGLERLKKHNPEAKIEIILRHPVDRTYSAYLMELNNGSINTAFADIAELLDDSPNHLNDWRYTLLIGMSRYVDHLKNVYKYFPKEQVSIVLYDDFSKDPVNICRSIFERLHVDPSFVPNTSIKHNETKMVPSFRYARIIKRLLRNDNSIKRLARTFIPDHSAHTVGEMLRRVNRKESNHPEMNIETRNVFLKYFEPLNEQLSELTKLDLSSWNK